jgi:hypothetical protein
MRLSTLDNAGTPAGSAIFGRKLHVLIAKPTAWIAHPFNQHYRAKHACATCAAGIVNTKFAIGAMNCITYRMLPFMPALNYVYNVHVALPRGMTATATGQSELRRVLPVASGLAGNSQAL